jgi:hypothetical protein
MKRCYGNFMRYQDTNTNDLTKVKLRENYFTTKNPSKKRARTLTKEPPTKKPLLYAKSDCLKT